MSSGKALRWTTGTFKLTVLPVGWNSLSSSVNRRLWPLVPHSPLVVLSRRSSTVNLGVILCCFISSDATSKAMLMLSLSAFFPSWRNARTYTVNGVNAYTV